MQINVAKYYPERFVKAGHLSGPTRATIEDVFEDELTNSDGKTEEKAIIRFAEPVCKHGPTELVLNKGRLQALIEAIGTGETGEWIGKTITMVPDKVQAFGRIVDTVIVKPVLPSQGTLTDEDDIQF